MKFLIYSFRTCPFIDTLKETFEEVFIFGKMNEDLNKFLRIIEKVKPEYILGVANLPKGFKYSKFETIAINQFHGSKRLVSDGAGEYSLHIPEVKFSGFSVSKRRDDSFCNWTAYKISHSLNSLEIKSKLIFVHLKEEDVNILNLGLLNLFTL